MEITILSDEENPMLHRRDVRFRVGHVEETPDRLAVRDSLAARLNKGADEVVIRRLDTKFGMRETIGVAKVYEGAAHAQEIEQEHMLLRNKIGVEADDGDADDGEAEAADADADADSDTDANADTEAEVEAEEAG